MYGMPTIYAQGDDQKNMSIQSTILPVTPPTALAGSWPPFLTAPSTYFSNSPQSYTAATAGFEISNNGNRTLLLQARGAGLAASCLRIALHAAIILVPRSHQKQYTPSECLQACV